MTVKELCQKINVEKFMEEKVCEFIDSYDFSAVEDILQGLTKADSACAAYEKMMSTFADDKEQVKVLACYLLSACRSYDTYCEMGISEEIFVDTMKCFTRFMEESKVRNGSYWFDRAFWTYRQSSMVLFRLGELEYEMTKNNEGRKIVHVHIPSDSKLTDDNIDESLRQAEAFLAKYYPDYAECDYECSSWLLAPKLKELLKADSNIIRFQNRFTIYEENKEAMDILEWVFKVNEDAKIEELPENTSLQKNMKALLLRGDYVGVAAGRLN